MGACDCGCGAPAEAKTGCLLCGRPLVYEKTGRPRRCAVCGGEFWAQELCEAGHYVCDGCHTAAGESVLRLVLETTLEKSPSALMERLWALPQVPLFGPEHHRLVPCVLLACYKNAGGTLPDAALETAWRRGAQVAGGSCGYWGACGAAIGAGIYLSVLLGSHPLNAEAWPVPQRLTAECLRRIAALPGPRCCKRDCRVAIDAAAAYTREALGAELPVAWSPCAYAGQNRECLSARCPYAPAGGAA